MIEEAPEASVEMCGIFCRKNVVVRSGGSHRSDIGKREGYGFWDYTVPY
jgi:hypothetical protein